MSDVEKALGTIRCYGILNTTILLVKINEIKYYIYTQMIYEEYYAEIDQKTGVILIK